MSIIALTAQRDHVISDITWWFS